MRGRKYCSVKNCEGVKYHAKGLCPRHYKIYKKYGDANYPVRRPENHNLKDTPEYQAWNHAIQRCTNKNDSTYSNYGARGVKVCSRWSNSFLAFYKDMGAKPDNTTLDRIDVNGNYEPSNCRWASWTLQARNKRKYSTNTSGYKGVAKAKNRWLAHITINYKTIKLGYFSDIKDAIKARKQAELTYWS